MNAILVYITASSEKEALDIGRALVSEKLAASVNMIPSIRSLYWWEGEIQDEREVVILAKTTSALFESLKDRVTAMHSYVCPCVIAIAVEKGHLPFLEWIEAVTQPGNASL
ncbi:MAG: divalent-cation tolerance protein CutA [Deltaproteobacteria bacterium]|nr:divalent-cation tolerance protein CutA [Deltaproteobacteria bacterium]